MTDHQHSCNSPTLLIACIASSCSSSGLKLNLLSLYGRSQRNNHAFSIPRCKTPCMLNSPMLYQAIELLRNINWSHEPFIVSSPLSLNIVLYLIVSLRFSLYAGIIQPLPQWLPYQRFNKPLLLLLLISISLNMCASSLRSPTKDVRWRLQLYQPRFVLEDVLALATQGQQTLGQGRPVHLAPVKGILQDDAASKATQIRLWGWHRMQQCIKGMLWAVTAQGVDSFTLSGKQKVQLAASTFMGPPLVPFMGLSK